MPPALNFLSFTHLQASSDWSGGARGGAHIAGNQQEEQHEDNQEHHRPTSVAPKYTVHVDRSFANFSAPQTGTKHISNKCTGAIHRQGRTTRL